jgi:hypothetical protein
MCDRVNCCDHVSNSPSAPGASPFFVIDLHLKSTLRKNVFVRYHSRKRVHIHGYQWVKISLSFILFRSRIIEIRFYKKEYVYLY